MSARRTGAVHMDHSDEEGRHRFPAHMTLRAANDESSEELDEAHENLCEQYEHNTPETASPPPQNQARSTTPQHSSESIKECTAFLYAHDKTGSGLSFQSGPEPPERAQEQSL